MDIRIKIEAADDVPATLSITMTIAQWREFRDRIGTRYPDWKVASGINALIRQVDQIFVERGVDV